MGLNGGKTLTRVALDDPGTLNTLTGTAQAINELADRGLAAMVEPFWSSRVDGKVRNDLSPDAVIKSIGVAARWAAPPPTPGSSCPWCRRWTG